MQRLALAAILLFAFALRAIVGWPAPNPMRAVDERYTLENVEALLRSGSFEPVTAYHPSLSFLPQTVALAAVQACGCLRLGTGSSAVVDPRAGWDPQAKQHGLVHSGLRPAPGLTALAYRSCRLFQALLGTLTVGLVHLLARRWLSSGAALLAALVAAGVPWLIWAGAICNEDAALVLTLVVAALATWAACVRPTVARFALVGVACGLALAAKLNGGAAALPIALWVAWRWREARTLVPRLALAGTIAAASFLVLNPHFLARPELVRRDFSRTVHDYERKGEVQQRSRLAVISAGVLSPLDPDAFGPVAGAAALAGALLMLRRRSGENAAARAARITVALGFPAAYLALYSAATRNVSPHNWLPLAPFGAILAACAASELWRWTPAILAASPPSRVLSRALFRSAAIAVALAPVLGGLRFTERTAVPTTLAAALDRIDHWARQPARIGLELARDRSYAAPDERPKRLLLVGPADGRRFTGAERELLDGWIEVANDSPPQLAAGAAEAHVELVEPEWLVRRGARLRIVWRPWQHAGSRSEPLLAKLDAKRFGFARAPLPAPRATLASLRIRPRWRWKPGECWLASAARERIALFAPPGRWRSGGARASRVTSERFTAGEAATLEVRCAGRSRVALELDPEVEIVSWSAGTGSSAIEAAKSDGAPPERSRARKPRSKHPGPRAGR